MNDAGQFEEKVKAILKTAIIDAKAKAQQPAPITPKKHSHSFRTLLFALAGILIAMLTVTVMPEKKQIIVYKIQDPVAYPIKQTGTDIVVRTLQPGEDFPQIRIGPGCSTTKRGKSEKGDSVQI